MTTKNQPTLEESAKAPETSEPEQTQATQATPTPENKLVKVTAGVNPAIGEWGIELKSWSELYRFAEVVIKAGMAPSGVKNPESAALLIQFGMELGMLPMQSLQNLFIVGNKPAMYGPIGIALARATGGVKLFDSWQSTGTFPNDDYTAVCEVQREGDAVVTRCEFSIADAKRAGIWGTNNWPRYPKDMLRWKAVWRALYATFADVLKGVAPGEFADEYVEATKFETLPPEPAKSKTETLADRLEQERTAKTGKLSEVEPF